MQTARHLVAAVVPAELATRMERRKHCLQRRPLGDRVDVHGNAAAVILHGYGSIVIERHENGVRMPRHRFVDGVVDDLVDKVMQSSLVGGADVHTRPLAHGFQAFQNLNLFCGVLIFSHIGSSVEMFIWGCNG
jgi:hypothetical protein